MNSFNEKILNIVSDIASENTYKGKWFSIIGDSISTYEGYTGTSGAYPRGDVLKVEDTWWHRLLTMLDAKLCVNISLSGLKACGDTEERDPLNRISQICRQIGQTYTNLDGTTETATEKIIPDYVLLFLGVNDWLKNSPLGEKSEGYDSTNKDTFYKAYDQIVCRCLQTGAKNVFILPLLCASSTYYNSNIVQPNQATIPYYLRQITEAIKFIGSKWRCKIINIDSMANTSSNPDETTDDGIHPNKRFMINIAKQCYKDIINTVSAED